MYYLKYGTGLNACCCEYDWDEDPWELYIKRETEAYPLVFHVQTNDDIDKDNSLIKGDKTFANKVLNAALSVNDKCSQSDSGKKRSQMHVLDRVSRLAFPFLFTLFNVVYWIYYLREYITRSSDNLAPYR